MTRIFNTAGPCLADRHYMIPAERRNSQIRSLVDGEFYFVIHAPRQSGKTTLIRNFARTLTAEGRYAALAQSFEDVVSHDIERAMATLLYDLVRVARGMLPPECHPPEADPYLRTGDSALGGFLADWAVRSPRPLVLLFDEVDTLAGDVLISLLRQLRKGYTARPAPFPQSVALVGLRDVRDYRTQLRPDSATLGSSSPFNIKVESITLRNFTAAEVRELLEQHTADTGQRFEAAAADEIFHQSQGQPWLVNALANQLVTRWDALVPDRAKAVTREHVMDAREILIERRDTHLDSLVARLHEDRVRRVVEPILSGGMPLDATDDDDFSFVRDLGLVSVTDGVRQLANPIYQEIIARVLTHQIQTAIDTDPLWYVTVDGFLDMPKLIDGFLDFWRRHGEVLLRGMPYQEAAPHLVFMAFLQRITNGGGQIDREMAVGTGRADLVVEFAGRTDLIELKLLYDRHSLSDGLDQVARYALRLSRDVGYLILFDRNNQLPWQDRGTVETVAHNGVQVTVVRA